MPPETFDEVLAGARKLPPAERDRLIAELSRRESTAQTDIVTDDKENIRTLHDALKERGLIGFMTDGPTDLSTNPKYMEGFGRDAG